jgi:hypothetical protein
MYDFLTEDRDAAVAALLVYSVWRGRDVERYKITPDVWGQVERFVKAAAKRSRTLPEFLERLKPRVACQHVYLRENMGLLEDSSAGVLEKLYVETGYVVALVRERMQREKEARQK